MGNRSAWKVVRVRPQFENIAAANLTHKGFEVFMPSSRSRNRTKESRKLLFPGYLFCKMSPAKSHAVLTAPGVLHLVGISSVDTSRVDDRTVRALRMIVQSAHHYEAGSLLYAGPKIRVNDGPLRNLEGILVHPKKRSRIAIRLPLLQRSVLVDLPVDTGFKRIPGKSIAPMPVPA